VSTLLTGLYAVYKGESNANDSLGVYNGTPYGGLTYSSGKSGNAFTFNGTTGLIELPNSSFDFMGDFSISAWVKIPSTPSTSGYIFSNYNFDVVTSYGYVLYINTNRTISFFVGALAGTSTVTSTTALALNTWYHITVRRDSVTKSNYLYINGTLEAQAINTGLTIGYGTLAIQPTIGAQRNNNQGVLSVSNFLNGNIDEVNLWNKALTATEVTQLYNAGTGKFYPY
jgi:hypothetical protein